MATYFDPAGRLRCSRCFHDLSARDFSGRCPSCNTWYATDRARVAPGGVRARMVYLRHVDSWRSVPSSTWRRVAQVVLAIGNAAIVGGLGLAAFRALTGGFPF